MRELMGGLPVHALSRACPRGPPVAPPWHPASYLPCRYLHYTASSSGAAFAHTDGSCCNLPVNLVCADLKVDCLYTVRFFPPNLTQSFIRLRILSSQHFDALIKPQYPRSMRSRCQDFTSFTTSDSNKSNNHHLYPVNVFKFKV